MTQPPGQWSATPAPQWSSPPAQPVGPWPQSSGGWASPPPADAQWRPERLEPVPGTEFGLVQLKIAPIASGPAIGSLLAGIASILVALLVLCFGLTGSSEGWGALVAGAFGLLAVLAGAGAIGVGVAAARQIRRSAEPGRVHFTGRGIAIAGISCGSVGAGIAVLFVVLSVVLQVS